MTIVNMLEAKTNLSKLVEALEAGHESEIVIARNGRPIARMVLIGRQPGQRLGVAKGKFIAPKNIDASNPEIEEMFLGDGR